MKVQELKYNLFLIDFTEIEKIIFDSLKKEFIKFGIASYEDIPRKDYIKLLHYFTLQSVCKAYNNLHNKKNTIFLISESKIDKEISKFTKEIQKHFPVPLYHTSETYDFSDIASIQELTLNLKEYRYSIDYSKYSFNKIKKFCKTYELESLLSDLKP